MKEKIVHTFIYILLLALVSGCGMFRGRGESAPSDRGGAAPSRPADDAALTAKVKAKLLSDDMLNALKIDVDSQNGTVFLSGVVDTEEQKERAVQLAQNTEGVRRVEDNLKVGRFEGSSSEQPGVSKHVLLLEDIG